MKTRDKTVLWEICTCSDMDKPYKRFDYIGNDNGETAEFKCCKCREIRKFPTPFPLS